jgi:biopolymer transport protein ExbD
MIRFATALFLLAFFAVACGHSAERGQSTCPTQAVVPSSPEPASPPPRARVGAIPFDLPRASDLVAPPLTPDGAPPSGELTPTMRVEISKDGTLSLNGQEIADGNTLSKMAEGAKAKHSEIRAVIFADRSTSWEAVVLVLDALKRGGVARLAFAVRVD